MSVLACAVEATCTPPPGLTTGVVPVVGGGDGVLLLQPENNIARQLMDAATNTLAECVGE